MSPFQLHPLSLVIEPDLDVPPNIPHIPLRDPPFGTIA